MLSQNVYTFSRKYLTVIQIFIKNQTLVFDLTQASRGILKITLHAPLFSIFREARHVPIH